MSTTRATLEAMDTILAKMQDLTTQEMLAAEQLNNLKLSNIEKLATYQITLLNKQAAKELELQQQVHDQYLKDGGDLNALLIKTKYDLERQKIDEQLAHELATATAADRKKLEEEAANKQKALDAEYKARYEADEDFRKAMDDLNEKETKARQKQADKERKDKVKKESDAIKSVSSEFSKGTLSFWSESRARAKLEEQGIDEKEQDKLIKAGKADALQKALAGFAKQLENTATEVAEAQSEIDTRLQGSKNKKTLGSYWREMSNNITGNIGISPFLKQETAVKNLQTLVGKGIAFNVEQRAFLDTISDKIATTFEATDASLLKLVRIQQADSTAARLGMESALTAFLNNMYETTEYMTEAADSIRASIYEASALMDAEAASEFEYQVQKWMGSLYSVGFNSTQGLTDALGKLAAGDISSITEGGYGNLLVMAANRAGISTAEILQGGLTDDTTNALLQAMVDYLGDIYTETKDNKVVAQQFASVYGLTASDLKAAANLASSTTTIYKNTLSHGGMLDQLTTMANSMGSRTATGTMMSNLFENLKYSTAASIGNDPVLYSTYMIASMLDDTVGGIAIPTIGAMVAGTGTEIDLETTVADLMRTGAMAGGLLGGIGKMIGGLTRGSGGGFSGAGMLKAFGVNTEGTTQVQRGSGMNLLTTDSGADHSVSGFIGNADGSVVKDKMITDAKDDANQQAIEALEEAKEIGLSNVDEHVVQIYTLLQEVISGTRNLHVVLSNGGDSSWTTTGYTPNGVPML